LNESNDVFRTADKAFTLKNGPKQIVNYVLKLDDERCYLKRWKDVRKVGKTKGNFFAFVQ